MHEITDNRNHLTDAKSSPKPLYEQVKAYVLSHIDTGTWPINSQIPSEHRLVNDLNMSRMTIHRALRELTRDGYLTRIQGVGTFVALQRKQNGTSVLLQDIRETIEAAGNTYRCIPQFFQLEPVTAEYSLRLGIKENENIIRSYFIHQGSGLPIVLEDRYTVSDLAPAMLDFNFTETTVDCYFQKNCTLLSHESQVSAILAQQEVQHFLDIEANAPCIQITRRTWHGSRILSFARLIIPTGRLQLKC